MGGWVGAPGAAARLARRACVAAVRRPIVNAAAPVPVAPAAACCPRLPPERLGRVAGCMQGAPALALGLMSYTLATRMPRMDCRRHATSPATSAVDMRCFTMVPAGVQGASQQLEGGDQAH